MKLLLDEMYTGLKDHLEVLGWKIETVKGVGIGGKEDRKIVEYARQKNLILVTQDQKPAELAELLGIKYVFISNASVARMVGRELKRRYPELEKSGSKTRNNYT